MFRSINLSKYIIKPPTIVVSGLFLYCAACIRAFIARRAVATVARIERRLNAVAVFAVKVGRFDNGTDLARKLAGGNAFRIVVFAVVIKACFGFP